MPENPDTFIAATVQGIPPETVIDNRFKHRAFVSISRFLSLKARHTAYTSVKHLLQGLGHLAERVSPQHWLRVPSPRTHVTGIRIG